MGVSTPKPSGETSHAFDPSSSPLFQLTSSHPLSSTPSPSLEPAPLTRRVSEPNPSTEAHPTLSSKHEFSPPWLETLKPPHQPKFSLLSSSAPSVLGRKGSQDGVLNVYHKLKTSLSLPTRKRRATSPQLGRPLVRSSSQPSDPIEPAQPKPKSHTQRQVHFAEFSNVYETWSKDDYDRGVFIPIQMPEVRAVAEDEEIKYREDQELSWYQGVIGW
ncbi:hypothetical protein BZG36_05402 [Bifiguratus adelaidae]|uniref:Uncharacterized protein n=1 Tax=Bifiguratus adelaidae TaxID=1938954 RepID=A0A261XT99_9FUNG|nr:hypothetical protein BZG36_05402 [Bifiguratus adelaidae]